MTAPDPHIPDPEVTAPMALAADYVEYRERAHAWIAAQTDPWNADDLAAAVPAARPAWPGSAVNSAQRAVGIAPVPVFRRSHRGEGSRKNSPLITWRTTLRPTHEEKNA